MLFFLNFEISRMHRQVAILAQNQVPSLTMPKEECQELLEWVQCCHFRICLLFLLYILFFFFSIQTCLVFGLNKLKNEQFTISEEIYWLTQISNSWPSFLGVASTRILHFHLVAKKLLKWNIYRNLNVLTLETI